MAGRLSLRGLPSARHLPPDGYRELEPAKRAGSAAQGALGGAAQPALGPQPPRLDRGAVAHLWLPELQPGLLVSLVRLHDPAVAERGTFAAQAVGGGPPG